MLETRYGDPAIYCAVATVLEIDNKSDRPEREIELIELQKYRSPRDAPALGQNSIALKTMRVKMPDSTG
jgi:hypothetical protein